jgi:hypothetical protein
MVQKSMQQVDDELGGIENPEDFTIEDPTDTQDENKMTVEEITFKIKTRFERSLPLENLNVIILMNMSHKHASIDQFEPLN